MNYLYLINFLTIALMTLLLFQFPAQFGFKTAWFEALRFIKPLTFFIFLCLPIIANFYGLENSYELYMGLYGFGFLYFLGASLKDKRVGFNTLFALILLSFMVLEQLLLSHNHLI